MRKRLSLRGYQPGIIFRTIFINHEEAPTEPLFLCGQEMATHAETERKTRGREGKKKRRKGGRGKGGRKRKRTRRMRNEK